MTVHIALSEPTALKTQLWAEQVAVSEESIWGHLKVVQWQKNPPANAGDVGDTSSIPGSGRSPRGGNGNPLQYACLENPVDRGARGLQSMETQRVRQD